MLLYRSRLLLVAVALLAASSGATARGGAPRPSTPEEIHELIAATGAAKDFGDAALVIVLDEADVNVDDSGLATTESCEVVKILTDAGVRARSVLRLDFDPDTYQVTLRAVRIHRKSGSVEDVSIDGLITQAAPENAIYWGREQHLLSLPRLEVGDALETRVSKTGFNIAYLEANPAGPGGGTGQLEPPMPGHWHETMLFQGAVPIKRKRYSVHMPQNKPLQYEVCNAPLRTSLWFEGDGLVYTFTAEDVPAVKTEPHMVDLEDCVAKVVLATVPDWETKSRWFHEANLNQFEANDEVRALAAELTEGLTSDEDKIAALNHWVADNVRYCGTSRGPREGFTLHRGVETLRDLAGVCKDKAGMLVTLLRAAGFEAYPALTMAGSRVEAIPADQFNHTVTTIRRKDGGFDIYDPTWIPLSREMWSSREPLQGLVYGTPEGQTLTLSPYYPPEYNLLSVRAESDLDASGRLQTSLRMDMKGYPCTYLRRSIDRQPPPEQRAAFEQALRIAPNARIEQIETVDPRDYSGDGYVDLVVSAEDYASVGAQRSAFRIPLLTHPLADWLIPDLFYPLDAAERRYGLHVRATRQVRYEEKIRLPATWKIARVPEAKRLDGPAAALSFEVLAGPGELTCRAEITLKTHLIEPRDYAEFKKTLETMRQLTDEWTVCTVESQVSESPTVPAGS